MSLKELKQIVDETPDDPPAVFILLGVPERVKLPITLMFADEGFCFNWTGEALSQKDYIRQNIAQGNMEGHYILLFSNEETARSELGDDVFSRAIVIGITD
jgi:hypothetical protein